MNANNKNYSIRPLTAEEREFAAEDCNYQCLFYFMYRWSLDKEEWYDILIIPYLDAVKKYHEYESARQYAFSTVLEKKLYTAVTNEWRKNKRQKRKPEGGICSLDYTMEGDNPFSENPIEAWFIDRKTNIEKQVIFKELFREFYQKCITIIDDLNGESFVSEYLKCELDLLLEGYTTKQVNRKTEKRYQYGYKENDLINDIEGFRQIFKEIFGF